MSFSIITRRDFVTRCASLAAGIPIGGAWIARRPPGAPSRDFRGVFAILLTPFSATGALNEDDLAREVAFCVRCGAHGLVWPQIAGEFYLLSQAERRRGAEIIVRAASNRRPVVIGVQAPYKDVAIELARHAESAGADALISLPPYLGHTGADVAIDYYRSLAAAVKLPIFIQNSGSPWGPGLPADVVLDLARTTPQLAYVKEEVDPVPHRLEAYARSGIMHGIFSGSAGRNLLNELPRGSSGTMPACEFIDVAARIYDLAMAGRTHDAAGLFERLLPMINLEETYGMSFAKAVLVRRGVFTTPLLRNQLGPGIDRFDEQEMELWWRDLEPYLTPTTQ